jgi:hypothetical protein
MPSTLDLLILPLVRSTGLDQPVIPGFVVAVPPRRPARFRDRDRLSLYLALEGSAPLPPTQIESLLENLAKTFYRTTGSVTTAQRAVASTLNDFLLDRNRRNSSTGGQSSGLFIQLVLREDHLYLAVSGPAHVYYLSEEGVDHYFDPQLAGQGLGLGQSSAARLIHLSPQASDALVLSPSPAPVWTEGALTGLSGQGPESLRRRLLSQAGEDLNSALLSAQPGNGQLRLLRPVKSPRPRIAPVPSEDAEAASPAQATVPDTEEGQEISTLPLTAAVLDTSATVEAGFEEPVTVDEVSAEPPLQKQSQVEKPKPTPSGPGPVKVGLATAGVSVANTIRRAGQSAGALTRKILPDESLFTIPSSTMAFFAIAVPIVIVVIASMVYFQRGRDVQYQAFLSQAEQAVQEAATKTTPNEQRQSWASALYYLDQAEIYQTTDGSRALRSQAQVALDQLDAVERLDYQSAIASGFDEKASIERIVAVGNDLYLLNATDGIVSRAIFTNQGYKIDLTFECGPGPAGGLIIGALKDIAALPEGNEANAAIAAIDGNGNLLQCIPGSSPVAASMQPPDTNWGTPQGMTVDGDDLFILDPQTNAVWIYRNMDVSSQPRLFFGEQIPPMQDVIDLAVNQNDLYLLHADGHFTTCVLSGFSESPTRCEEPAYFTDPRPGKESGPLIEGANFSEIQFSQPPDPSIYLLDPLARSLYNLSVRLTFDRQYLPQSPFPVGEATAFGVNKANRTVFMALGNQVYYAALP